MSTETLKCEFCDKDWQRELKRGRKPKKCPDCKADKVKSGVNREKLKNTERKYKQRVQMSGKHFKPLGDPTEKQLSHSVLTVYESFETAEGEVHPGDIVKEHGQRGSYVFKSLVVREDGTAYANLVGFSGAYQHKYRAIGVERLTI